MLLNTEPWLCVWWVCPLYLCCCFPPSSSLPQWGPADVEIKVFPAENTEILKCLSLKSGEGQNIALLASHTAENSAFLISTFPRESTSFFLFLPNPLKDQMKCYNSLLWDSLICWIMPPPPSYFYATRFIWLARIFLVVMHSGCAMLKYMHNTTLFWHLALGQIKKQ